MKDDTLKRLYTIWFQLYDLMEKACVTYGDSKNIGSWGGGVKRGRGEKVEHRVF